MMILSNVSGFLTRFDGMQARLGSMMALSYKLRKRLWR